MALKRLPPASGLSLAGRAALRALAAGTTPPAGIRSWGTNPAPLVWLLSCVFDLQAPAATAVAASSAMRRLVVGMVSSSPLETEDPDDAALAGMPPDVLIGIGGRSYVGRVVGADVSGEEEPVTTDAGVDRDVLFAVRTAVGDRIAYHAGANLELGE